MLKGPFVAAVLVAHLGFGHAALVDRQSYTTDTVSGLDWLDLTATQGQSINDAAAGPLIGQGWRIATYAQVLDLYGRNLGTSQQFYTSTSYEVALEMARMLGIGFSTNTDEGLVAIYDAALPVQLQVAGGFVDGFTGEFGFSGFGLASLAVHLSSSVYPSPLGDASAWLAYPRYISPSSRYEFGGVYMVRATPLAVPEPASILLVAVGLALAVRRYSAPSNRDSSEEIRPRRLRLISG